ncbi:hypothetical protein SLA2020_285550 [Shorea laevis]
MKIVSFNVRGLGGALKKKEVGKLMRMERPDLLFLQETKLEIVDNGMCRCLWHSDGFEWAMKESVGAAGGLLCIWDNLKFVKDMEFTGEGYIGISGVWGPEKKRCHFVNVYAPNDRQKKLKVWEELSQMIVEKGGRWMLARDFNAVRCIEERKGRTGETPEMRDFDNFIESTGLVDVRLTNQRFTWYRPDGTSMSRLDRFLVTPEMSNMASEWQQQGIRRTISNHCAIIMKARNADWGPKPFRVLDAWQQHPDFKKFVEEKWNEMKVTGYAGYRCQQKLKQLKGILKSWNKEVFGDVETQFEKVAAQVEQMDLKSEFDELTDWEVNSRKEGFQEMWDIMRKREALWKQKSRSNWIRFGDENTSYFHRMANGRRTKNTITSIMCDGRWVEEPDTVKKEVVQYFRNLFQADSWRRPRLGGLKFRQISEEDKVWPERPFSVEEIEEALKSCDGSKAPGPDGYNFNFIKVCLGQLTD